MLSKMANIQLDLFFKGWIFLSIKFILNKHGFVLNLVNWMLVLLRLKSIFTNIKFIVWIWIRVGICLRIMSLLIIHCVVHHIHHLGLKLQYCVLCYLRLINILLKSNDKVKKLWLFKVFWVKIGLWKVLLSILHHQSHSCCIGWSQRRRSINFSWKLTQKGHIALLIIDFIESELM